MRRSHTAATIMLVGALLAMGIFLQHFLAVAALAVLTVVVFNPLYKFLCKFLGGRCKTATILTVLIAMVIAVIPLILVAILSYYQALTFFSDLKDSQLIDPGQLYARVDHSLHSFTNLIGRPGDYDVSPSAQSIVSALQSLIPTAGNATLEFLRTASGGLIDFFTGLILYIVLLFYLFLHQNTLVAWIKRISPLASHINERYLSHMTAAGRSMVLGTFVVGAVQGVLGAAFLWLAGIPYPIFWAVILTVLSFIPLGGGILTIPIALIQLALGNIWQGLFLIGTHFLVITNIDNVLRAMLVSKDAQLPPILTLFAAFAGVKFFGPLGVIYGPILMAIIMTTFQIYNEFGKGGIPLKPAETDKAA